MVQLQGNPEQYLGKFKIIYIIQNFSALDLFIREDQIKEREIQKSFCHFFTLLFYIYPDSSNSPHNILYIRWISEFCSRILVEDVILGSSIIFGRQIGSYTTCFQQKSIPIIPKEQSLNGIKGYLFARICDGMVWYTIYF